MLPIASPGYGMFTVGGQWEEQKQRRVLGSNLEDINVCKCTVPLRHGGILNSRRAASPLVWLMEGKERLSIANTLIHGLLKKPSPTSSLAEDENDEPRPKRFAFHIKQLIPMKLGTCLKWLGIGIIEVGAGMMSAWP
ncbi:hypothetical protein TNCV_1000611 [Trichonephila clavipes]|nr:hypothetical protein TNCV_1000611 [Trichonephila clavipes]